MTRDRRSIGMSSGEVSDFLEYRPNQYLRYQFNCRQARSLFLVRLPSQEFGEVVGDARTTEFLHRDSHLFAARICGLNRLCSTRAIIRGAKRTENTGPIRVSAKYQIGAKLIS